MQKIQLEATAAVIGITDYQGKTISVINADCERALSQYPEAIGLWYPWSVTVDSRKICPTGWHVATNQDWQKLISFLGGENIAGGKLKVAGISLWNPPNSNATNLSGFAALPGGKISPTSTFKGLGPDGFWWSSTEVNVRVANQINLNYMSAGVYFVVEDKRSLASVRCVKDNQ